MATTRRDAVKKILLGTMGAAAASEVLLSREEDILCDHLAQAAEFGDHSDSFISKMAKPKDPSEKIEIKIPDMSEVKGTIPMAQIGSVKISRLILGGNLLTGFVHSRDLVYVGNLARHYNTKEKVFQTFAMAEECGINTFLAYPGVIDMTKDYWSWTNGKIQYICDSRSPEQVQNAIDSGAVATYVNGNKVDDLVRREDFDTLAKCLEQARKNGVPGGFGAHHITSVMKLVEKGMIPDFWMKTYHSHDYWSSTNPTGDHDNKFCHNPDQTREFMASRKEPWIAFKVCAAGAIPPAQALPYAFDGGADFVCLGMYDFQLIENVKLAAEAIKNAKRTRPWSV